VDEGFIWINLLFQVIKSSMNKVYEKEIEVNRKKADFSVSEKSLQLGKMRRAKKAYLRISFQKSHTINRASPL
jgi:hypothetical protein